MRILVVEDDAASALIVKRALKKKGIRVSVAGNGQDAIVALKGSRFEALITDWMMPGMDGMELIRRIRNGPDPHLPIVVVTALVSQNARIHARKVGADAVLPKPFSPRDLYDTLKKCMKQRSSRRESHFQEQQKHEVFFLQRDESSKVTKQLERIIEIMGGRLVEVQCPPEGLKPAAIAACNPAAVIAEGFSAGDFDGLAAIGERVPLLILGTASDPAHREELTDRGLRWVGAERPLRDLLSEVIQHLNEAGLQLPQMGGFSADRPPRSTESSMDDKSQKTFSPTETTEAMCLFRPDLDKDSKLDRVTTRINSRFDWTSFNQHLKAMGHADEYDARDVAALVKTDPALKDRLIAVSNRPRFAKMAAGSSEIEAASMRLGLARAMRSAMFVKLKSLFSRQGHNIDNRSAFFRGVLATALLAEKLVDANRTSGSLSGEAAFVTGLLSPLGALLMDDCFPSAYEAVFDHTRSSGTALAEAEVESFGFHHGDVAARMCRHWKLEPPVPDLIAQHMPMDWNQSVARCARRLTAPLLAAYRDDLPADLEEQIGEAIRNLLPRRGAPAGHSNNGISQVAHLIHLARLAVRTLGLGDTGERLVFDSPDSRQSPEADVMDLFTPRVMEKFYKEFSLLTELVGLNKEPVHELGEQARTSRRAVVIVPQSQPSHTSQAWLFRLLLREFGWQVQVANAQVASKLDLDKIKLMLILEPEGTPEDISGNLEILVAGLRSPPKLVVRSGSGSATSVPKTNEDFPIEWLCGAGFDASTAREALA